jgi:dihydrodipicolinate synthase/N-acetylneuraminate lyase
MSVDDTGKEILLSGWEGKNLTSADLVTWISDAYNVSAELGAAMLTDFKNNSSELAAELRENDYTAGIKDAYDALRQYGDIKLVDEQEIKTIAKLLGVNEGKVRDTLVKEYGATETQFYDEKGQIKSYEDISSSMNAVVSGAEAGKKWTDAFYQ